MMQRRFGWTVLALIVLAWVPTTRAQGFNLTWYTIDGGGGTSAGSGFAVAGTIGQPDAGVMAGAGFEIKGGFWPGPQFVGPPMPGDLDADGDIDLDDYNAFLAAYGSSAGDQNYNPSADFDGDNFIGMTDFGIWYGHYLAFANS